MSSYSDLATQIINKKGQGGRFSGLNQFLDVKQAYAEAQRKFQMDQQLAREQGRNSGYASIINSSNINGTDPSTALNQFNQAVDNRGVISPTNNAGSLASGSPAAESPTMDKTIANTPAGFSITASTPDNSGKNEAFLANLNPDRRALIKQLSEYKANPTILSRGNAGKVLAGQVAQYDPSFDAGTYAQRQSFVNGNWNKGDLFKSRQAIENLVQHVDLLQTNFDKIDNGNLLIANAAGNSAKIQTGKSEVTNALMDAKAVGTEMAKTLRGGGVLNQQEQEESQKQLNAAASPDQMHGAIQQMMHLAAPRINSSLEMYKSVMGKYPKGAYSPEAISAIQKVSPDVYSVLAPKLGVQGFVDAGNQVNSGSSNANSSSQSSSQNSNLQSLKSKYGLQ